MGIKEVHMPGLRRPIENAGFRSAAAPWHEQRKVQRSKGMCISVIRVAKN